MELKRVVITGLGAVTPLGNDVASTWEAAKAGRSGAAPITHFDASKFKTQFACEVKNFDANEHFDRKKARQLDLYAQYGVVAARQAVADAKLDGEDIDKTVSALSWQQVSAVFTPSNSRPAIMPCTRNRARVTIRSSSLR